MIGRKLINQSLIYGLASLLINGSNLFLIPLYTHYLTTTEFGIVSSVAVFSTMTTAFLTFGLNGAVTRFYFDLPSSEFRSFLFSIFCFQIVAAASVTAVIFFGNGFFLDKLYANVPFHPYLKYGLFTGVLGVFATLPLALLQATSRALVYRLFTTTSFVILTTLMIIFIIFQRQASIGGIKAPAFAGAVMALAYSYFILRQSTIAFQWSHLRTGLTFGLPIMVYTIFGSLLELSSKYFIERLVSLAELGIFNVAQQIASVLILVTNAINMAWTPIFYEEAKKEESSPVFTAFGKFLIFSLTLLAFIVSLFAPELIDLFVSADYTSTSQYVPILLLAYIIGNGYWILVINPLTFARKTIFLPLLTVVSGAVAVFLNVLLIPRWAAMGAALSSVLSYIVLVGLAYLFFRKHSRVIYDFRAMNGIVVIALVLYLSSTLFAFNNALITVVVKLLILVAFFALVILFKLYSPREVIEFTKSGFRK